MNGMIIIFTGHQVMFQGIQNLPKQEGERFKTEMGPITFESNHYHYIAIS